MRRSGAYTLPDFAEARLGSLLVRRLAAVLVVAIGWMYLVPQFQGASLALQLVTGAPQWVGSLVVAVVVAVAVGAGGMRSITFVQAMQYWIKLTCLAVPAFVLIALWMRSGGGAPAVSQSWSLPFQPRSGDDHPFYRTASMMLALCLGTMGLPHVLVRYYTNPDGVAARRTTVSVVALLGVFYLLPPVYAVLGRLHLPSLPEGVRSDTIVIQLPARVVDGLGADLLTAMLAGGAFAALLSTASGLAMSVTGVLHQEFLRPRLSKLTGGDAFGFGGFRLAAVAAVAVPFIAARFVEQIGIATTVGFAFSLAAATFAPLLILGRVVEAAESSRGGGRAGRRRTGGDVSRSDDLRGWPAGRLGRRAAGEPGGMVHALGLRDGNHRVARNADHDPPRHGKAHGPPPHPREGPPGPKPPHRLSRRSSRVDGQRALADRGKAKSVRTPGLNAT